MSNIEMPILNSEKLDIHPLTEVALFEREENMIWRHSFVFGASKIGTAVVEYVKYHLGTEVKCKLVKYSPGTFIRLS